MAKGDWGAGLSAALYPLFDAWDRSDRPAEWARLSQTQWLSAADLTALQLTRLNALLDHCRKTVPYYEPALSGVGPLRSLEELRRLPILTKDAIRAHTPELMSRGFPKDKISSAKTGGSTGTALTVYFDRLCEQHRHGAALRTDAWAGWRPGDWRGALWGSPELPANLKQRIRNRLHARLVYLDTMRLDAESMTDFVETLHRMPVRALFGHSHSIYILAQFVLERGLRPPPIRAIVSTSMMLLPSERQVIEQAFSCPVSDRYGCEEVGLIAAECERHQGMHVNAEHLITEIVDEEGMPCAPGVVGRVIVTDLLNRAMPLLRYEVGDLSSWATVPCPCGRGLPTLERIVGRQADCLQRHDGSLVAGVSLVERTLTAIGGIAQLQLVQEVPDRVTAYTVLGADGNESTVRSLREVLERDLGAGIRIEPVVVPRIPQERNGKYRFAIRRF